MFKAEVAKELGYVSLPNALRLVVYAAVDDPKFDAAEGAIPGPADRGAARQHARICATCGGGARRTLSCRGAAVSVGPAGLERVRGSRDARVTFVWVDGNSDRRQLFKHIVEDEGLTRLVLRELYSAG